MIAIEAAEFVMGSETGMADERPLHRVTLSPYRLSEVPVTQSEWRKTMHSNPAYFSDMPVRGEMQLKRPVEKVSCYDVYVYCNRRSIDEHLMPCYYINGTDDTESWGEVPESQDEKWDAVQCRWDVTGYRLPTEAEWEYAARGGPKMNLKKVRSDWDSEHSWHKDNSAYITHTVGMRPESILGFQDIFGNVLEWCWDWYDCYKEDDVTDPRGAERSSECLDRVVRGGAWNSVKEDCSPCFRNCGSPCARYNFIGVRLARSGLEG